MRSQRILPVRLSSASSFQTCFDTSFAGSTSPYRPVRMPRDGSLLIAADTKTRSPQTTGLDTATPSTGVFHATLSPVAGFQVTAVGVPSATPEAFGPRNMGQFWAAIAAPIMQKATKTRKHEKAHLVSCFRGFVA